jgi:hypothetical protein
MLVLAGEARAQCSAREVLQNRLDKAYSTTKPKLPITAAADVSAWKTIAIGTFGNALALMNALDAAHCGVGASAAEVLARPAFTVSATRTSLELFAVSAAELGFETDTASLADIYARALRLGFGHAPAEAAAQLRLQYFDQPLGEFLIIGMEPIKTWKGEPVILTVANGGAGLILIGQDGSPDARISATSRFLFARDNNGGAPADQFAKSAAVLPP